MDKSNFKTFVTSIILQLNTITQSALSVFQYKENCVKTQIYRYVLCNIQRRSDGQISNLKPKCEGMK